MFLPTDVMRKGVSSAPQSRWASRPGPIGPNPSRMVGFRSRSRARRACCVGHRLERLGVDGDVDVRADAVVGRQPVLQHARADLIQCLHASLRRCPVVVRVTRDGQVLQDRVELGAGLDVEETGQVPTVECLGEAEVALVHPLQPGSVQVVGMGEVTDLPHLRMELTRRGVLGSLQEWLLDQSGLADTDVPQCIGERGDVLERDRTRPGRLTHHGQVAERGRSPHHLSGQARVLVEFTPRPGGDARRTLDLVLSGLVHRRQAIALRGLEGLDRRVDGPDLITGRGGDRRHRARGFAQCGDGGVDVPRHAASLPNRRSTTSGKPCGFRKMSPTISTRAHGDTRVLHHEA